jgi:hypothetical protein
VSLLDNRSKYTGVSVSIAVYPVSKSQEQPAERLRISVSPAGPVERFNEGNGVDIFNQHDIDDDLYTYSQCMHNGTKCNSVCGWDMFSAVPCQLSPYDESVHKEQEATRQTRSETLIGLVMLSHSGAVNLVTDALNTVSYYMLYTAYTWAMCVAHHHQCLHFCPALQQSMCTKYVYKVCVYVCLGSHSNLLQNRSKLLQSYLNL